MDWDAEVDVLCVGAGIAGLATAVAAADAGADVMVTGALCLEDGRWVPDRVSGSDTRTLGALLGSRIDAAGVRRGRDDQAADGHLVEAVHEHTAEIAHDDAAEAATDSESADDHDVTAGYFAGLTEDLSLDSTERPAARCILARTVRELSEAERNSRTVETFFGARLAGWAQECLGSIAAAVYSTVRGWTTSTVLDSAGRRILLAPIGTIEWGAADGPSELFDWLATAVAERDIAVTPASSLTSLVFEDRRIVGAELQTPDGPYSVRARHGVVLSPDFVAAADASGRTEDAAARLAGTLAVCIVAYPASRFARVELVTR